MTTGLDHRLLWLQTSAITGFYDRRLLWLQAYVRPDLSLVWRDEAPLTIMCLRLWPTLTNFPYRLALHDLAKIAIRSPFWSGLWRNEP